HNEPRRPGLRRVPLVGIAAQQRAQSAPSPRRGEGRSEGGRTMKVSVAQVRRLRRDQTDAERLLWLRLRDRRLGGLKFRRQKSIDRFVVDFFCADTKLIVELDGGQHGERGEQDAERTRILESMGYLVLRFRNHDVIRNIDGVLEEILGTLNREASEPP